MAQFGASDPDFAVRLATFEFLDSARATHGDVLPRSLLAAGFEYRGERVPLVGPQGIFKPRVCSLPLSITTVAGGPYADSFGQDGLLRYKYRGTDPQHRDNVGLREALRFRVPLAYFHGHLRSRYHAVWPVFVVGDNPDTLTCTVAADDFSARPAADFYVHEEDPTIRRAYVTATVRRRLHQSAFRERVLDAYRESCAFCQLRHRELLDASHIVADSDPLGEPAISNGLALCKLHHAPFDQFILTVDPEYRIRVRRDILEEIDGPMLKHGIQEMEGQLIRTPSRDDQKPAKELLALRLERFRSA